MKNQYFIYNGTDAEFSGGELEDAFFFSDKMGFCGNIYNFQELRPLNALAAELDLPADSDFGCIICNLYAAFNNRKPLAISRDKTRTKDAFLRILSALKARGYVKYRRGFTGAYRSFISRYWACGKLVELFRLIQANRLKDYVPPVIQMTQKIDDFKVKIPAINKPVEVIERAEHIKHYNSLLNHHTFTLEGVRFLPYLSAVYCNGDYTQGGRLYSVGRRGTASFQGFSGDERLQIKIDDEDVTELDYKCLHPHLLYAERGLQLRGDAYAFASAAERPLAKLLLLVSFNAGSETEVCKSFNKKICTYRKHKRQGTLSAKDGKTLATFEAMRGKLSAYKVAARLLRQAKEYHSQIADAFGSGAGTHLQNVDANIMQVIINQCVTNNIPVLPVHDSVVCKIKDTEYVQSIMYQVFRDITGVVCPVENKRTDSIYNPLHDAA